MGIPPGRHAHHHLSDRAGALTALASLALAVALHGQAPPNLEAGFRHPPASARPKTFWQWMNGNVSREGITLDLEAMRRVGIGGAMIFDGGTYLPQGPVGYLSPQWRELMTHAIREGERLGIEIGMHNAPGWSSSGGPWITPERSMQELVWTETTVSGPGLREVVLPRPRANLGYYRDALVLAFPAAPGEERPQTTQRAADAISMEFAVPFEARAISVFGRFSRLTLEASDDGAAYRRVATVSNPGQRGILPPGASSFPPVRARFFRLSGPKAGALADVVLHHTPRIDDWNYKANFAYRVGRQLEMPEAPVGEYAIAPRTVRDLSAAMDREGRLKWEVPAGAWTVLRLGHTTTGQLNVSASRAGRGLECDKFSREAAEFHFRNVIGEVLAGAGKGLRTVIIDSYETGMQNWTAGFPGEFRRRAGYDPRPYLPAMTGRIVGSRAVSERFLFDLRRVQADLMAANYYGRMGELCRERGLEFYVEGYGPGVFDELQVSGLPDVPTTEFWERTPWTPNRTVKMVSSAAHIYGKPVVASEAFTGEEQTARWLEYPYSLKILGDLMFSLGVNQMLFHRYAHQPHPTAVPGMTMGPWGFHMDRTNTWFEQSSAWLQYLARCQYLLRQGAYVADLLYFTGERPPGADNFEIPAVPEGFSYDLVNAEALLTRATVEAGCIRLGGGSYRVLVLPPDLKGVTPELMRKLREISAGGVTMVGPQPQFSPTLRGYPESENEMRRIAGQLWASGRIGSRLELHGSPDFEYSSPLLDTALSWIHRRLPDAEIYFIGNRQRRVEDVVCTFRVQGRAPEFWNPENGDIRQGAVYSPAGGRVRVPLHLEPAGSLFVVFRHPAAQAPPAWFARNGERVLRADPLPSAPPPSPENNFTMTLWAKPDTDLRLVPRESITGRIDETGKFYAIPAAEGDTLFGKGHAAAGLAVGRNGVYVIERARESSPAVLVANLPISGWTHFAVVYRAGKPSLYVNGKFVREGLASGSTVHPGIGTPRPAPDTLFSFDPLDRMMRSSGRSPLPSAGIAYYFEGNLTEPELFDHALSGDAVSRNAARGMPPPADPAPAEVWRRQDGRTEALLWRSGTYRLAGAASATVTVPPPITVNGPWRLAFEKGRSAPASINLGDLISLHRHPDPGVRYFSGTVAYSRTLEVPPSRIAPNRRVYLDLGRVEVSAQVLLNGKDLGILWKEPYRLDVTEAARAGNNHLEIRVATLWPNRLIGDEQLPPENRYGEGPEHGILELPRWYTAGQPKPPGGRVTFATWHFYRKDDPLLEAGLLGPVRLLTAVSQLF